MGRTKLNRSHNLLKLPRLKAALMGLVVLTTGLPMSPAVLASTPASSSESEFRFKMATPKLDPRPTHLKGGVQHSEHHDPKPPKKLSAETNRSTAKADAARLQKRNAKMARVNALKSNVNQLKSGVQAQTQADQTATVDSGIGIIGVKFMLAFGRPPVINRVFPGTPAAQQGLSVGDVIVAVDGVPTFGLTKEEVYNMIVGSPGTPVTVSVRRKVGGFAARCMVRMDFNDIKDPIVKRDYMLSM